MTDATTTPTDKAGEHCDVHHLLVEFANSIKGVSLDKRIEYLRVFTDRINALTQPHPSLSVGLDREVRERLNSAANEFDFNDYDTVEVNAFDLRSLLALAAPAEGYVLVPVEPTVDMIKACDDLDAEMRGQGFRAAPGEAVWSVMIAACLPAAPTGETGA